MTAIRDTYLVEQSLLRTLGPLLGVRATSLYRINDSGVILRSLHHSRDVVTKDGARIVEENLVEETLQRDIDPVRQNLFDSVRLLGRCCSRKVDVELLACYPLYGKGTLLGFFVFQRDREVTPAEDAIIHGVLEVFTNYFDLLDTSQRDQLTGLFNRYSLEINLDRLWSLLQARLQEEAAIGRKRSGGETFWIGVLDIDHFKRVNDTYGHVIGDEVLVMATQLLKAAVRESDLIYRYGGEEFVVIVVANDAQAAATVFERVRVRMENFYFPQVGCVTVSCGFCGADPNVLPQEIINRADRALYAAKDAGRNKVFNYETLVKAGSLHEPQTGSVDLF